MTVGKKARKYEPVCGRPKATVTVTPAPHDHNYGKSQKETEHDIVPKPPVEEKDWKARCVSLETIEDFQTWTNLPNRAVFQSLVDYLKTRKENLKYWRGQQTNKYRHYSVAYSRYSIYTLYQHFIPKLYLLLFHLVDGRCAN